MGKFTRTVMAKKMKKIEVCFDVLANKLAKSGNHKIYMRFFSPEGVVIFDKVVGSRITMNPELKTEMLFTISEELEYSNEKKNVCIEWDTLIKYKPGPYTIKLYTGNNKMGVASFVLR